MEHDNTINQALENDCDISLIAALRARGDTVLSESTKRRIHQHFALIEQYARGETFGMHHVLDNAMSARTCQDMASHVQAMIDEYAEQMGD